MKTDSKGNKKAYVVVLVVLLVLFVGGISFLLFGKNILPNNNNTLSEKYKDEELISSDTNNILAEPKEMEFTELFGYDTLEINNENPSITLRNSSNNKVLLKYDVYNNNELIFTSEMLKPGDVAKVNVLELLEPGEHNLEYHISSYDQLTQNLLTSDIIQKQKIVIS